MNTLVAYWGVVLIWATTPLGIALSSEGMTFWAAAAGRSLIALLLLLVIMVWRRQGFIPSRQALIIYVVAAVGFAPQMTLVYWASQHVPSGVMSLLFALNPCFIYLLSALFLKDSVVVVRQLGALVMAVIGMALIYLDQLTISSDAALGMVVLIFCTLIFSVMSVLLKHLMTNIQLDPMSQNAGTLLFSCPLLLIFWWLFDGEVPVEAPINSVAAVIYLAVFGSVIGSTLYFYIFKHMSVVTVSLITLITPLFAVTLGYFFHDEPLSSNMLVGAVTVIVSLLVFENIPMRVAKLMRPTLATESPL